MRAGGVVGYNTGKVNDCTATNADVIAGEDGGGVVGYNISTGTVYNNCTCPEEYDVIGGGNTTPAPLSGEDGQQNVTVIS